ncbi:PadR family transcriptional regulator [Terribacillus sp. DMT04]|uniref:PadR family transcriptional regulator n=1 Tax=Terribacillus sp. DMT04 TaxID=2850441 RepID=UPI001C2C128D|nr:PadR family transcriptional regulator [Terribacillus sp. DMT04]QXE02334.1 PadR family transcriptional regulator [Terribacillus sp. DMT04]
MNKTSLLKGHLEMCVLSILKKHKSYGYEIMKELEKYDLKLKGVSSIYPILTKLKDQRWVDVSSEITDSGKARIYYTINHQGEKHLENIMKEWKELQTNIKALLIYNEEEL